MKKQTLGQRNKTESPISEFPNSIKRSRTKSQKLTYEPIEKTYTIDDLIDVWCRGCTNGATLWQYCQDTDKKLPNTFEAGLIELTNEIRIAEDRHTALKNILNNNMLLLGVFEERT
jgi:hypothetical protein